MRYHRDKELLERFGKRVKALREAAELSKGQVQHATGISHSNIYAIESGQLNTSLSQAARLAEFFGIEIGQLIDSNFKTPDIEVLQKSIDRFLKKKGIDPKIFITKGLTRLLKRKILGTPFLGTPKYSKEVADYIQENFKAQFTTTAISQALENLRKKGLVEKLTTDKKSKFQYRKK